jgi:diguanylate cyclase (GGDEF)-like protein/PAS domain S-box-containing protein
VNNQQKYDAATGIEYCELNTEEQEKILQLQQAILELVALGGGHMEVINRVCQLEEQLLPNSVGSVMLLDPAGHHLDVYAAPSIPPEGIEQLNGLVPGPCAGSCGNVIYRQEPVFVSDISTDARWEDLRQIALDFGLMACWSMPIRQAGGKVIGTFALSSFEPRSPGLFHLKLLEIGAFIIGIALEQHKNHELLRLWAKVFDGSSEAIMITDTEQRIVTINRAFTKVTQYTDEEAIGKTPKFLASGRHDNNFYQNMWQSIERFGHWQGEIVNRRKNGETYPEWLNISSVRDETGKLTNYVAMFSDISERKNAQARIEFLAYYDRLTDLPNYHLLRDRLALAISYAARSQAKVALLYLDLDNFQMINDSLGHLKGDELLKSAAARLRDCLSSAETISRQGGDEFLVMLTDVVDSDAVANITCKILEQLALPFMIGEHELMTSFSIGIAVYPDDGADFDSLLKKAGMAVFQAKQAGRNTYRFYDSQMNIDANWHLRLRSNLGRALARNELILHYQPQFNLASGKIIGVEALIRWNHPEHGMLVPASFIHIAEDSGLIIDIGSWVLNEACRQARAWQQSGLPEIVVAVNLSALQFRRGNLEKTVMDALTESGLDPRFLELEITESLLIQDAESALDLVKRLKALGVQFSIDDFGTGYSSLAYLKRLHVDKLKIDQSFIRNLASDSEDAAIVHAILQMARSLNMKTIAEGVEEKDALTYLKSHYCDEVQGFYFARPMPSNELASYLAVHG